MNGTALVIAGAAVLLLSAAAGVALTVWERRRIRALRRRYMKIQGAD